ncbi:hypothetical protein DPMN_037735 [Dreissena polymorpha]|uniref:Uncharacterized protein n=1 Tax=Dreissena polymorpha TaxID=45954 RepID=A0A9D4MBW5_DREPO|nr:hypothetical protein DPMN_037735 [Dreissena polymorpha]
MLISEVLREVHDTDGVAVEHVAKRQQPNIIGTNVLINIHEDLKINVASRVLTRKNGPPFGSHVFQPIVTIFELIQDIIETNILTKFYEDWNINVASREITMQILTAHDGQKAITKAHHEHVVLRNNTPFPGGHAFLLLQTIFELNCCIQETSVLTKCHEDWTKKCKTAPIPGGHVFPPIMTIFEPARDIYKIEKTHVVTKFHEDWTKNVTSIVFTCFHNIHIEKTASPSGGHPPGGHLHEDWASNVTCTVFTSFKLSRGINGTNVVNNFHEDRT